MAPTLNVLVIIDLMTTFFPKPSPSTVFNVVALYSCYGLQYNLKIKLEFNIIVYIYYNILILNPKYFPVIGEVNYGDSGLSV